MRWAFASWQPGEALGRDGALNGGLERASDVRVPAATAGHRRHATGLGFGGDGIGMQRGHQGGPGHARSWSAAGSGVRRENLQRGSERGAGIAVPSLSRGGGRGRRACGGDWRIAGGGCGVQERGRRRVRSRSTGAGRRRCCASAASMPLMALMGGEDTSWPGSCKRWIDAESGWNRSAD